MEKYFVSYNCNEKEGSHYGHMEMHLDGKIEGINSIRMVARHIEEQFSYPKNSVVILNFKRFDTD